MNEQRMSGNGPLTSHYQKYSSAGLFDRYSRGRIKGFKSRLVFAVLVSLALAYLILPVVALLSFLASMLPDLLDCWYLHQARNRLRRDAAAEKRVRSVSSATAALHGIGVAIAATAPLWSVYVDAGSPEFSERHDQLFSIALLTSAAINAGLLFPFHRIAVFFRLAIYTATPILILIVRGPVLRGSSTDTQLHFAGLLVFFGSLIWLLTFTTRGFH